MLSKSLTQLTHLHHANTSFIGGLKLSLVGVKFQIILCLTSIVFDVSVG